MQPRRRLLLISYHFPPSQTAGALRWQQLARFAVERGWGLDVITLDPSCQSDTDPHTLDTLPEGVRVYGVPDLPLRIEHIENTLWGWCKSVLAGRRTASGPSGANGSSPAPADGGQRHKARAESFARHEVRWLPRSPRDLLRAYAALVDFRRGNDWARRVALLARSLVQRGVHDAVVSCGPPHMAHEAGRQVASMFGLPFVMDLRDPWSFVQRLPGGVSHPLWWQRAERYERAAVARAARVVANTEPVRRELMRRYPERPERFITVMNGYDDEPMPVVAAPERFTIAYAGSIYLDRSPRLLFRAAGRVLRELNLTPEELGIELIGHVGQLDGIPVAQMAQEEGVTAYVSLSPRRPRRELMELLAGASMLVSLPQDSDMAIPSKIFEYMRFHAWLLALAEPESATGTALEGTSADVVRPTDLDGIAAVIKRRYLEHTRGVRPEPIAGDTRFSRSFQAGVMFDAIEACVQCPASRTPSASAAGI
ncbi:MAG TPA: hypothetical protein VFW98_06025 [Gemmatimonadaceae bacterium]|nr:hypothetical protein [Gemmatimonadaceae bacterium]